MREDVSLSIEKRVRSFARWVRLGKAEAEELVQHTIAEMASLEDRGVLDTIEQEAWPAYAARIAQRRLWNQRGQAKRERSVPRPGAGEPRVDQPSPDALAEYAERKRLYKQALETLDPTDRMIVVLRVSRGLTYRAIAEALNIETNRSAEHNEAVVRKRYARALKTIREMTEHG